MQTFSQFHFSIIPSKQISETVYQELKNKIEKIGNTTEKYCKYYDIKQMYFAEYTNMQNSRLNMIWEEHLNKNIYDNIDL